MWGSEEVHVRGADEEVHVQCGGRGTDEEVYVQCGGGAQMKRYMCSVGEGHR